MVKGAGKAANRGRTFQVGARPERAVTLVGNLLAELDADLDTVDSLSVPVEYSPEVAAEKSPG